MEQVIEQKISLPDVSVQIGDSNWENVWEFSPASGYYVCQRLSDEHSGLRMKVGNSVAGDAFTRARSVGLVPWGCPVRLYPAEGSFRALSCIFEKDFFESETEIQLEQWAEHAGALMSIKSKRVEVMMQQIYAELVEPAFASDLAIEAASTLILVEMARYERGLGTPSPKYRARLAPWQIRRINDRIEASLEIGFPSVAELARLCGISQSHLMRTFKGSTGWQIHKYIAEERLKAAKSMLLEDQLSVNEVSARLGFCSPAYFSTAFRRMCGVTPKEFRRQARVSNASAKRPTH